MKFNTRRKIALAAASSQQKDRLTFVRKFYDAVYTQVISSYIDAVGDGEEITQRFQNPETSYQSTPQKGGGSIYWIHAALRNYSLSVELLDTKNECQLSVTLGIFNPYTDKQVALIDAFAKESVDTGVLDNPDARTKFARRAGGQLVRTVRQQIADDMPALIATLDQLKSQVKTYSALLATFKTQEPEAKVGTDGTTKAKARTK